MVHLSINDIALDDLQEPSMARINIKLSQIDGFHKVISQLLMRTSSGLCLVGTILGYLQAWVIQSGLHFSCAMVGHCIVCNSQRWSDQC